MIATIFRTIGASAVPCLGLAAAVVLPNAAIGLVLQIAQYQLTQSVLGSPVSDPTGPLAALGLFGLASIAIAIVSFLATVLFHGAIVRVLVERVRGRSLGALEALRGTLPRYLPLLGAYFLVTLAIGVGSLLCLIPGILASLWLAVAVSAAACEEVGPIDALGRSIDLTEGSRGTIFLVGLVIGLGFLAMTMCILSPALFAMMQSGADPSALQDPLAPAQLVSTLLGIPLQIGWLVVAAAMNAVIYAKLRGLRDDVDAQSVAEVFA